MKRKLASISLWALLTLFVNATELERSGWNLISICQNMSATEVNITNITEIQSQDGEAIYTGDWAKYSNLENLYAGYGYWVKGDENTIFDSGVAGDYISQPLKRDGWNLMASCQNISRDDINMSGIEEIQSQSGESIYTGSWEENSNLDTLLNGYGYWVKGDEGTLFTSKDSLIASLDPIFNEFNVGFGDSSSFPFASTTEGEKIWLNSADLIFDDDIENNDNYTNIKNFDGLAFDSLQNSLKSSKFLVYWFVKGWEESWFDVDKIQQAMDRGVVPVFNYWYFGDELMNDMPDDEKKSQYSDDYAKVATFLNQLNGKKILIMEPEFNKNNVLDSEENQRELASIIGNAIDYIKANTSDTLFSLAMTDTGSRGVNQTYDKCGYENCALGDKYEWGRPEIIYNELSDKLDFISFQQMIGQFSRDPLNPGDWESPNPKAYSDEEIGIDLLADRINNFSKFLSDKYHKPVFLPYIAIATATWSDDDGDGEIETSEINKHGWEEKANNTYKALSEIRESLKANGLFGFAPMALFDNPRHDYGGYQFFMNNEYHLGLIGSSATDEVDIASNGDLEFKLDVISYIFGDSTTPPPPSAELKYHDVLGLSLKFYEAQRAVGPFPTVDWRKPASTTDGSDVGVDLNGGWFDAGDHVKFNLPMSYSVGMLNWSMLAQRDAYIQAGKLEYGKEQVKYALDYLLNTYQAGEELDSPADDKVYFQVADGYADHSFWGPPEELDMDRPTFSCDSDGGCAAVSGAMVGAFASGAILFQDDEEYSQKLLDSAKRLHEFAMTYPTDDDYSSSGQDFYKLYSNNNDQRAWGAIWLYRATNDSSYLGQAKELMRDEYPWGHAWDNMILGVSLLLFEEGESDYQQRVENELNAWIDSSNGVSSSAGGLRVRDGIKWGNLRYASSVAFISLMYADMISDKTQKQRFVDFGKSQIDYMLGDNPSNFSYVVGYGDNYPIRPHHRAASGVSTVDDSNPNRYIIEGALVGGPMSANDDDYQDVRDGEIGWTANEVATDYNAGFTGALAKLALIYGESSSPE